MLHTALCITLGLMVGSYLMHKYYKKQRDMLNEEYYEIEKTHYHELLMKVDILNRMECKHEFLSKTTHKGPYFEYDEAVCLECGEKF